MAPAEARAEPEGRFAGIRPGSLLRWETALAVALVVVVVLGTQISSQFLSSYNIFTLCTNIGDLAIMALPMTLIIITGEIDLSVASILALAAELLGYLWMHHWPMALIFVVVLAVGAVAGAINGLLITRVGLPSLAVTIGTLTLYRGLANVVLGPTTVSNFPTPWSNLGVTGFLGIQWLSWSVAIFAVLAVAFGVTLRMTPLGRSLYAIGCNQEAAFHAGHPRQADQARAVHAVGPRVRGGRDAVCVRALLRRREHRHRLRAPGDHDRAAGRRVDLRRHGHDPWRRARRVRLCGAAAARCC